MPYHLFRVPVHAAHRAYYASNTLQVADRPQQILPMYGNGLYIPDDTYLFPEGLSRLSPAPPVPSHHHVPRNPFTIHTFVLGVYVFSIAIVKSGFFIIHDTVCISEVFMQFLQVKWILVILYSLVITGITIYKPSAHHQ